ncbi:hypothetical protein AcV5_008045 [Taiwanofungus camphoratus]|nr:hypothetical protein AcV5_008045 [Antrodia cinnamomea]
MDEKTIKIFKAKQAALKRRDMALLQQVGEGKDIMSILMNANMAASDADKLPEKELIAQMSTLIFAGMDTTSNALSRALQNLAKDLNVQEHLRDELLEAHAGDNILYDELNSLPYLDAVCRETLRLYSLASFVSRVSRKHFVLPLSQPISGVDGKMMDEIPTPKGTEVFVGILGSNTNKAAWGKDALEWIPDC